MSSVAPAKIKKPPTAAQAALAEKKAAIREILKAELSKAGMPYKIGMNAQAVAGYNVGLRGEDLLGFVIDRREHAPAKTAAAAATAKKSNIINKILGINMTKVRPAAPKTAAKKPSRNVMVEVNAMLARMPSGPVARKMAAAATQKKKPAFPYRAYQLNSPAPAGETTRALNRSYKYKPRRNKTVKPANKAKDAEIAALKREVERLRRLCVQTNAELPSPPRGENAGEALRNFLNNENEETFKYGENRRYHENDW